MIATRSGFLRGAVAAALCVAYPLLAYLGARAPQPNIPAAIVAFAPLLALLGWLVWQSAHRFAVLLLAVPSAWLLWNQRTVMLQHYDWAYLLQHAGTLGLLAFMFGRTLRPGSTPLVSRFAQIAHGSISARVARYTRGVTWTWTLFFAAMTLSSLVLFVATPLPTWALFANLLSPLLVLALFVAEYLVRLRALPAHERTGPIEAIRAYARYSVETATRRDAARAQAAAADPFATPSAERR
uniref:Transmembrane protein n=1 Tax=mine drainage metagenome TaxID=410659 RepID=E6PKV0_9ZZZZ